MLYRNTESGKQDELEKVRMAIDKFITRLDGIEKVNDELAIELLKEANSLSVSVNGVYGSYQDHFDAENVRLFNAYSSFWERIDKS